MRAVVASLALLLAAALLWQWRGWPPPRPQPGEDDSGSAEVQTPPAADENPLDLLTPLGEKDEYAVVTERPLFLPDRRPPSEEPEQAAEPESEQLTDLDRMDLNAVMITPASSLAWVRDPAEKKLVRLEPGDDLAGWSVQEIHSDRVLLERQGEEHKLILRDYKNMPPPQPSRQKPAARKPPRRAGKRPPSSRQQGTGMSGLEQSGMGGPDPGRANARKPDNPQKADAPNAPRANARDPRQ